MVPSLNGLPFESKNEAIYCVSFLYIFMMFLPSTVDNIVIVEFAFADE